MFDRQPVAVWRQVVLPGYVIGVKRTSYGVGARVVLRGVTVDDVAGRSVSVSGRPTCLPPAPGSPPVWCGAMIPTIGVTFPNRRSLPSAGDVIDLYGTTGTSSLTPTAHVVVGHCDPWFGC